MPSSSKVLFIGRDTFLQDMHVILQIERKLVITGAGGVGKTDVSEQPQSHFLFITRFPTIPPEIPQMELTSLDEQEGALLMLRRAKLLAMHAPLDQISEEERIAALELARELRGLPLSLNLVGGYLCEKKCRIQDYLFAFRDHPVRSYQLNNLSGRDREEISIYPVIFRICWRRCASVL